MSSASQDLRRSAPATTGVSFPVRALHLYALSAFACAQPLFDILARNAEFFAVRRSQPIDLIALVFVLIVVVPLPLVALLGLAGWIGERIRGPLQSALVGLLFAAILLPPLSRASDLGGAWVLAASLALGALAGLLYARRAMFRGLLTFAAAALVAFPAIFLFDPAIRKIAFPRDPVAVHPAEVRSNTPVVLVVFDAFPLSSLLGADQRIDARMFPHFTELAQGSIWFRNATTVSENTIRAVPAILTGRNPERGLHPTVQDHPANLFTLLQRAYRIHAEEPLTSLNPTDLAPTGSAGERVRSLLADLRVIYLHLLLPEDWTGGLPPISQSWKDFAASDEPISQRRDKVPASQRSRVFLDFVERIDPEQPRSLWFLHSVLPHPPHKHYSSGRPYSRSNKQPSGQGDQWGRWNDDEWAAAQGYQRHLLQVSLVDNLVGRLIARLRDTGLWDTAVIVVTADHGASYRAGDGHRELTDTNFADILAVPLFVRAPGRESDSIDDANVQATDILPTIADLLDVPLTWKVDGLSVFDPSIEYRTEKHCYRNEVLTFAADGMGALYETAASKLELFRGTGPDRLFRLGPHGDLVGRPLRSFPAPGPARFAGRLNEPELFRQVSPESDVLPGEIVGVIERPAGADLPWIAVAVNGVVRAVSRPYEDNSDRDAALWAAVVPEDSFESGENRVELFTVERGPGGAVELRDVAPFTGRPNLLGVTLGASPVWGVKESGFYYQSREDRTPYRWTNGKARLIVPVDPANPPRELVVELLRRGPLPLDLEIVANGVSLYSAPVPRSAWSTTVSLDSVEPSRTLKIELLSGTWVPMEVTPGSLDKRRLSVAVKGVTLR